MIAPGESRSKRDRLEKLQVEARELEKRRDAMATRLRSVAEGVAAATGERQTAQLELYRLRGEVTEVEAKIDAGAKGLHLRDRFANLTDRHDGPTLREQLVREYEVHPPPSRHQRVAAALIAVPVLGAVGISSISNPGPSLFVWLCAAVSVGACAEVARKPGGRKSAVLFAIAAVSACAVPTSWGGLGMMLLWLLIFVMLALVPYDPSAPPSDTDSGE